MSKSDLAVAVVQAKIVHASARCGRQLTAQDVWWHEARDERDALKRHGRHVIWSMTVSLMALGWAILGIVVAKEHQSLLVTILAIGNTLWMGGIIFWQIWQMGPPYPKWEQAPVEWHEAAREKAQPPA